MNLAMSSISLSADCQLAPNTIEVRAHRGGLEVVDRLANEWRRLCADAADDQPFFRPEFIRAHIRAHIPGARVVIITASQGGRLLLLMPLVEELGTFSKVPVRKLRAPVDLNCGRFDAVRCSGPDGDAAIPATWRFLREMPGWDQMQLRYSQAGSTVSLLVAEARSAGFSTVQVNNRPNPYIPVPGSMEPLEHLPRNSRLRTKLRQIRRNMSAQGSLRFCRADTADRVAIDRIFALEASGWKGRAGTAVNCRPQIRQFFDELACSAASFGYLCLYTLEFEGQLIAAHFCLEYKGRCYSPVVAFNEEFKQFAPGHLIVSEILRECVARGISGYDITGEDQEWKMKWTEQALPVSDYLVFKGPIGRFAYNVGRLRSIPGSVPPAGHTTPEQPLIGSG